MSATASSPDGRWKFDVQGPVAGPGALSRVGVDEQGQRLYAHPYFERYLCARFVPSGELILIYHTEREDDPGAGLITRGFVIAEVYRETTPGDWLVVGGFATEQVSRADHFLSVVDVGWHDQIGLAVVSTEKRDGGHARVLEVRGPLDAFSPRSSELSSCRKYEERLETAPWLLDEEGQWTELSFDPSGTLRASDPKGVDAFDFAQRRRRRDAEPWRAFSSG